VAAEVREWLERAADDLREAEHDLGADPPLVRGAVFHSQQAAEKALKAFLAAHDRPFRKTHDLDEVGRAVTALDSTLATVVDRAKDLTPYAWRFRYPGAPVAPTEDETREALTLAREVHAAILTRLPEEVRP
ncbi:MAG: HEPN domain-containing protein, partial [Chloroflexi bacterium]|nr:HEPN domain-containing protein [Chloroflexota bacterium]